MFYVENNNQTLCIMLFYRLDILTYIKRPDHQLPEMSEERDYVTDKFTVAESTNLLKVRLHLTEIGKEVRSF